MELVFELARRFRNLSNIGIYTALPRTSLTITTFSNPPHHSPQTKKEKKKKKIKKKENRPPDHEIIYTI